MNLTVIAVSVVVRPAAALVVSAAKLPSRDEFGELSRQQCSHGRLPKNSTAAGGGLLTACPPYLSFWTASCDMAPALANPDENEPGRRSAAKFELSGRTVIGASSAGRRGRGDGSDGAAPGCGGTPLSAARGGSGGGGRSPGPCLNQSVIVDSGACGGGGRSWA